MNSQERKKKRCSGNVGLLLLLAAFTVGPAWTVSLAEGNPAKKCGSNTKPYTPDPVEATTFCRDPDDPNPEPGEQIECVTTRTTYPEYTTCGGGGGDYVGASATISVFFEGGGGCGDDGTCKPLSDPVIGTTTVTACTESCV